MDLLAFNIETPCCACGFAGESGSPLTTPEREIYDLRYCEADCDYRDHAGRARAAGRVATVSVPHLHRTCRRCRREVLTATQSADKDASAVVYLVSPHEPEASVLGVFSSLDRAAEYVLSGAEIHVGERVPADAMLVRKNDDWWAIVSGRNENDVLVDIEPYPVDRAVGDRAS